MAGRHSSPTAFYMTNDMGTSLSPPPTEGNPDLQPGRRLSGLGLWVWESLGLLATGRKAPGVRLVGSDRAGFGNLVL